MTTTTSNRAGTAWDVYESPLGPLTIQVGQRGVFDLSFPRRAQQLDPDSRDEAALADVTSQLDEYFAGERRFVA